MPLSAADRTYRATGLIFTVLLALFILPALAPKALSQEAPSPADATATQGVIEDQISAFKAGDGERAYSHAAPGIKQAFTTVDRFMSMVQTGYLPLYNPESYTFGRNAVIGGQVHQEVIVTDPSGKQWQAVYTLARQEDGSWKITGVKLNPYKAVSA
jgi:hypothetical protein